MQAKVGSILLIGLLLLGNHYMLKAQQGYDTLAHYYNDSSTATHEAYTSNEEEVALEEDANNTEVASYPTVSDSIAILNEVPPQSSKPIAMSYWQKLSSDSLFFYKNLVQKEKDLKKPKQSDSNLIEKILVALLRFFSSRAGQAILWIVLGSLLLFFIYKIVESGTFALWSKKPKTLTAPEDATLNPDDLYTSDWQSKMIIALEAEDYRLSIRFSYLYLLQTLDNKGLIQYLPKKTNTDYYFELNAKNLQTHFKNLSRTYEYAWYGNYPVDKAIAQSHVAAIRSLIHQLSTR